MAASHNDSHFPMPNHKFEGDGPTRQHNRMAINPKAVTGETNPNGAEKPKGAPFLAGETKNY
jgi:hypothetical protein